MKIKKHKKQTTKISLRLFRGKGFSLVEILLYIAIFSAVSVAFITFMLAVMNSKSKVYAAQEVHSNNRHALNLISRNIRLADSIITPATSTASTTLELDMPGTSPNLTFEVTNGVLFATETGNDAIQITSNEISITELKFINYSASSSRENIKIYLSAEYRYNNSKEYEYAQSLETTVTTRK